MRECPAPAPHHAPAHDAKNVFQTPTCPAAFHQSGEGDAGEFYIVILTAWKNKAKVSREHSGRGSATWNFRASFGVTANCKDLGHLAGCHALVPPIVILCYMGNSFHWGARCSMGSSIISNMFVTHVEFDACVVHWRRDLSLWLAAAAATLLDVGCLPASVGPLRRRPWGARR